MNGPSKAVLIVDDNDLVRSALKSFLEDRAKWVVSEAADGAEAISKAKELKPDLIIMDLVMPNVSGLEAASVIRNLVPDARIVVFTLYSGDFGKAILRSAGVDLVVEKVEGAAGLMNALQSVLAENGSSDLN